MSDGPRMLLFTKQFSYIFLWDTDAGRLTKTIVITGTHIDRPVAHFMGDGEGHRQSGVLVDVAAAVRLTHPRQMGQAESLTGLVHPSTDVFPGGGKHRLVHRLYISTTRGRPSTRVWKYSKCHLSTDEAEPRPSATCRLPRDQHGNVVVSRVRVALGV